MQIFDCQKSSKFKNWQNNFYQCHSLITNILEGLNKNYCQFLLAHCRSLVRDMKTTFLVSGQTFTKFVCKSWNSNPQWFLTESVRGEKVDAMSQKLTLGGRCSSQNVSLQVCQYFFSGHINWLGDHSYIT